MCIFRVESTLRHEEASVSLFLERLHVDKFPPDPIVGYKR